MPPTTKAKPRPEDTRELAPARNVLAKAVGREESAAYVGLVFRFRRLLVVVVQLALVVLANYGAFLLRFDGQLPDWAWQAFVAALPALIVLRVVTFLAFRLFEGLWRYTSLYDLAMLVAGVGTSTALFLIWLLTPWAPAAYPRSILIIDAVLLLLLLGGIRLTRRLVTEFAGGSRSRERVLVYGAGNAGELIVRETRQDRSFGLRVVGFIDDDVTKLGRRIHGVPVLGTRESLPKLIAKYRPTVVLLAIPEARPELVRAVAKLLEPSGIRLKTLPRLRDLIDGEVTVRQMRSVSIEDLLPRPTVGLSVAPVRSLVENRRILVTGAGGSIGSELCRQILRFRPAVLILFERYENSLHTIRMELDAEAKRRGGSQVFAIIGDVTDEGAVSAALERHRPEIVFHAAAHKHVPLMEENPCEAVKNNVRGTRILAAAAERAGVDRFIMISTDKAANPTTVMGASKRIAEQMVMAQSVGSGTSYAVVRFGNVLGSNGSVVPFFEEQIRRGGPVTVTHPDVKRFFMLIPEAVSLVLHAAAKAHSGGTYVLNMGEQIRIVDLAETMIRQAGHVPGEDILITFTGLRAGEKLEEELTSLDEELRPSDVSDVSFVVRPPLSPTLREQVSELEAAAFKGDRAVAVSQLLALAGVRPADLAREWTAPVPQPVASASRREGAHVMPCPACATGALHRSKARTAMERMRRLMSDRRLYRCDECGWRGWREPTESAIAPPTPVMPAADLSALDAVPPSSVPARRRSFAPRDL